MAPLCDPTALGEGLLLVVVDGDVGGRPIGDENT
jgi:hypothetical protein